MKHLNNILFFLFTVIYSFGYTSELNEGQWIGKLKIQESHHIKFRFEVDSKQKITIHNDQERVEMKPIQYENDSIKVYFTSFPNYLIFKIDTLDSKKISGYFINPDRKENGRIFFNAVHYGPELIVEKANNKTEKFEGKWQVLFNPQSEKEYLAIGKFKQNNDEISGTFLTTTGDYRFLKGSVYKNKLRLSSFDGAHVFLFTAELKGDTLKGEFLSGNHYKSNWIGFRNDSFELENPDSITYMVKDNFTFNSKTIKNQNFTFPNEELKNKVVIIQILGTWCPNCLDETIFFNELYEKYHHLGLEIIGVAYEAPASFEEKVFRIKRFTKNKNVNYPVLVGGQASKKETSKDFSVLNEITSFPTSVFLNKKGEVIKIHTGFNGPGTGEIYTEYKKKTKLLIEELLNQ